MIEIIPMTESEADGLNIDFSLHATRWGMAYIASTQRGICAIGFCDDISEARSILSTLYSNANLTHCQLPLHHTVVSYINKVEKSETFPYPLHIPATPFRLKVWSYLLSLPSATTVSYGEIARKISSPSASRAVGSAVGANPVAIIIPCHRVIRSDGTYGQYRWGADRKAAILTAESLSI